MDKIKIIDEQNRSLLGEGRRFGMGFAFLKRINNHTYTTVQPISTCKDYLNDVIFNERIGLPISACGLVLTKKSDIFDDEDYCYLVIKMLDKGGQYSMGTWAGNIRTLESDTAQLAKNYTNIAQFLNYFELKLHMYNKSTEEKTEIYPAHDDMFLVKIPKKWAQTTYLISLYTLLLRSALFYEGKEPHLDYLEMAKVQIDQLLYKANIVLKRFLRLGNVDYASYQDFEDKDLLKMPGNIHSTGINSL